MKFSIYNLVVNNDLGGVTLCNTFNEQFACISGDEDLQKFDNYYNKKFPLDNEDPFVKELYNAGIIVDDNIDEYAIAKNKIYKLLKEDERRLMLTLYVTNQCNFRCVYCPQEHETKIFSETKWNALYNYIKTSCENDKYDDIYISFFGGEPLLETDKIVSFLEKLKILAEKYNEKFFHFGITTNGYLLYPDVYDKLTSLGLINYQITLDGFADNHNKTRKLVNGKGTWEKIVENLQYINSRDDNACIAIRTNYNKNNIDSLEDFNNWCRQEFDNPKMKFLFYPVSEFSENVDKDLLAETIEDDKYSNLLENYEDSRNALTSEPFIYCLSSTCKACRPSCFTISAEGKISKCENIPFDNDEVFIGYLSDEGKFELYEQSKIKEWEEDFEFESCQNCVYYPLCAARACPAKKIYNSELGRIDCLLNNSSYTSRVLNYVKSMKP